LQTSARASNRLSIGGKGCEFRFHDAQLLFKRRALFSILLDQRIQWRQFLC
jgi:hypothetical protein